MLVRSDRRPLSSRLFVLTVISISPLRPFRASLLSTRFLALSFGLRYPFRICTMSWQAYVDDHLLVELSGGRKLSFAAVVGLDGGIWAQSEAFPNVSAEQLEILIAAFDDETTLQEKGVHLGEQRYFAIQGEPGSVIRGKHKTAGFTAKKTNQAVILGGYNEGVQPGECNMLVENVADELLEEGY